MDDPRTPRPPSTDPVGDGVRVHRREGPGARRGLLYLALAALLVAGVAVWLSSPPRGPRDARDDAPPPSASDAVADAPESPGEPSAPSPATARRVADATGNDPMGDLSDYVPPGQVPTMGEVIERLHAAGVRTGLGAFQPPGTSPPLIGLAVPEDFPLPEGYVRHYQATDDGQRIEPILMFSPDFEFFDADGKPVPIPADRVVPPDMAPPGLPIRRIEIPRPRDGGGP